MKLRDSNKNDADQTYFRSYMEILWACVEYHKWNGKNKFNASIQVHLSKIKKANEIEEKYQIARGGLVAILGLANYRGVKGNIPVMADGDPVKSYSRQAGRNYTPG
jgi:hypothetical protein